MDAGVGAAIGAGVGGLGIGALAGVGGAGHTYAGLGLIPSLKQKKVRHAVLALLAGLPIGYLTADKSSKWLFNRMNQRFG